MTGTAKATIHPSGLRLAHVAPVFPDRDATMDECCAPIAAAARNGARPVAFEADEEARAFTDQASPDSGGDRELEAGPQVVRLRNERRS